MNEKLYVGCGPLPIHHQHLQIIDDSWVLIDLYVEDPRIVKMDACKLEYADNSIEKIYSSHLLEHIEFRKVPVVLKEWFRALKKGGELILNVPNLEWVSEQLCLACQDKTLESPIFNSEEKIIEIFVGNQDHEGEFHRSGFTKRTLESILKDVGFLHIEIKKIYEAHQMGCLIGKAIK
jgi:predicted SAM-dependent methyltransferase